MCRNVYEWFHSMNNSIHWYNQTKNAYYELVPSNLLSSHKIAFSPTWRPKIWDRHGRLDIISGSQLILYGSACQVELQNNLWCLWWQGLEVTACKPRLSPSRIVNYSKARSLLIDQDGAGHCDDHCDEGQCTHRTCCLYRIPHSQWCQGVDSGP